MPVLNAEEVAPETPIEVGLETMEEADRLLPLVVETNTLAALLTVEKDFP
jgi:hypothetical protein